MRTLPAAKNGGASRSEKFGNQMELAEKNIKSLESEYTDTLGAGGFFRGTDICRAATRSSRRATRNTGRREIIPDCAVA